MSNSNSEKWADELPFMAVTLTDKDGKIIYMNDRSARTFEKSGGKALIGSDILACHNPDSQKLIGEMTREKTTNAYTIEKEGVKKLIYQTPWYRDGEFAGLAEFSMVIPAEMPHFVRK